MRQEQIYRIIDVNLNRVSEGLRVIEDGVRFILNDSQLAHRARQMRHSLIKMRGKIPELGPERLLKYRDSRKDVGASFKEEKRKNVRELIRANFKRVEEAERSLEEFSKLLDVPSLEMEFKEIRFQTYTLEKETEMAFAKTIPDLSLYVIADSNLLGKEFEEKIRKVISGGATVIQVREKASSTLSFLNRAIKMRKIIGKRALFIVNDRVDIAVASGADGVHLGQEDLPIAFARKIMGEDKIIGISTHSIEQAQKAEKEGADYVAVGPIFSTQTKPNSGPSKGVGIISEVKRKVNIPVVAIGGINRENVEEVIRAGADGVAVISAVFKEKDVGLATCQLYEEIQEARRKKIEQDAIHSDQEC